MPKADMTVLVRVPLVEDRDRAILACERLTKERDEARGIANELFDAYRAVLRSRIGLEQTTLGVVLGSAQAYRRIRPEVRARLEGK